MPPGTFAAQDDGEGWSWGEVQEAQVDFCLEGG